MNLFCLKVLDTDYQSYQTNQTLFLNDEFKNDDVDQRWTRLGDFICSAEDNDKCIDFKLKGKDIFNENVKRQAFVSNRDFKVNQKWILRSRSFTKLGKNHTLYLCV